MEDKKPVNILMWWKARDHSLLADSDTGRPEGLPRLAQMARQYLGEPASSAGAECLFSKAGNIYNDLASRTKDHSLEHALIAIANTDKMAVCGAMTHTQSRLY